MNALYKTLSLSACALLVFKLQAWPNHLALVRANADLVQAQSQARTAQRMLDFASSLPAQSVVLDGPDQALSSALESLQAQAPNHGIKISQVIARDVPITQQVFATSTLRKDDPTTDTLSQKLLIKGSYIDLVGLRSYLKNTLSPRQGMVVSDLTIKGDALEIGVVIHSAKDKGSTP